MYVGVCMSFLSSCGCVYVSVLVCNFVQLVQLMHVYT